MNETEDKPAYAFISVVIPTYNRGYHLEKTLGSLLAQDYPHGRFEIILVDNTSSDDTAELVRGIQAKADVPLVYIVKTPEGPGPARNLGVERARGTVIAFIDSDCVADTCWLSEGVKKLGGNTGIVQGMTLPDPDAPWKVLSRSVKITELSHIYECCNLFYLREAILSVGGFAGGYSDDSHELRKRRGKVYELGGEDMDLAYRVMRQGWQGTFAEAALVYHEVSQKPAWRWLIEPQFLRWPSMVRKFPEVRSHFFLGYFFARSHALLVLLYFGLLFGLLTPWLNLAAVPYLLECAQQRSIFWRGPVRLFRVIVCMPRDTASLVLLLWASIRSRTILL